MENKNKKYEIPPEGSLGLLAIGYKGLIAWREKRKSFKKTKKVKQENKNEQKEK
jgi:hypothetical protein